jgi:hypothetical protein
MSVGPVRLGGPSLACPAHHGLRPIGGQLGQAPVALTQPGGRTAALRSSAQLSAGGWPALNLHRGPSSRSHRSDSYALQAASLQAGGAASSREAAGGPARDAQHPVINSSRFTGTPAEEPASPHAAQVHTKPDLSPNSLLLPVAVCTTIEVAPQVSPARSLQSLPTLLLAPLQRAIHPPLPAANTPLRT